MRNGGDIVEKYTLNDIPSNIVVVDGSRVMTSGDRDKGTSQVNGHILNSCKLFLEKRGANTILCVKKGTYHWMLKSEQPGWEVVEKMKNNGEVKVYEE